MVHTYEDFAAVLEIEIQKLQDAEDYLNEEGETLLRAYRKIRKLTTFAASCQELLELEVEKTLDPAEEKAAAQVVRTIHRIAEEENREFWKVPEDE